MRVAVLTNIPEIGHMTVKAIARAGHVPLAIIAADKGQTTSPAPGAPDRGPTVEAPTFLATDRTSVATLVDGVKPDLLLSWAFPWRIPDEALDAAPFGGINFHPSLLPRHRGPNPVGWAIRSGDGCHGITWHRMTSEFDAGPILAQRSFPDSSSDTTEEINLRMSVLGVRALKDVLERVAESEIGLMQDPAQATHAPPFGPDYARFDVERPARYLHDQVRAWTFARDTGSVDGPLWHRGEGIVRVLQTSLLPVADGTVVACADGEIWVTRVEEVPDHAYAGIKAR